MTQVRALMNFGNFLKSLLLLIFFLLISLPARAAEIDLIESVVLRNICIDKKAIKTENFPAASLENLVDFYLEGKNYFRARNIAVLLYCKQRLLPASLANLIKPLERIAIISEYLGERHIAEAAYLQVVDLIMLQPTRDEGGLILALRNIARFLKNSRKDAEAEIIYSDVFTRSVNYWGRRSTQVGKAFADIGDFYISTGRHEQALLSYENAISIFVDFYGKDSLEVASLLSGLARVAYVEGGYDDALKIYSAVLDKFEEYNYRGVDYAEVLFALANVYRDVGKTNVAEVFYMRSLAEYQKSQGVWTPASAAVMLESALNDIRRHNTPSARVMLENSFGVIVKNYGRNHPEFARVAHAFGVLRMEMGDYSASEEILKFALSIRVNFARNQLPVAESLMALAELKIKQNSYADARTHLLEAAKIRCEILDADSNLIREIHELHKKLLRIKFPANALADKFPNVPDQKNGCVIAAR